MENIYQLLGVEGGVWKGGGSNRGTNKMTKTVPSDIFQFIWIDDLQFYILQ